MLRVFNTKKPNVPPVTSEGVPDDEPEETIEPEEKSPKPHREWVEALKRAESIEQKFKNLSLYLKQANCVYPTAILTHLMLLSIMTSNSEKVTDADVLMDSPSNISSRMIKVLFADRSNGQGITDYSIAELCHQRYQVPIYKQFAEDILTAFTELILAKVDGFPINSWLKFKSLCEDHFNVFISAHESIWERFTRHFPWHERGVSESSFSKALEQLKQKEWAIHPGYIAAKEIIDSVRDKRGLDETLLDNQNRESIKQFTNRIDRNLLPYTGLAPSGELFALEEHQELQKQSRQWGIFYSRQILRYALESLLCCLEKAVDRGCPSIEEVVNTFLLEWMEATEGYSIKTFADLLRHVCRSAGIKGDEKLGLLWSQAIRPHHENFEYIEFHDGAEMFADAMTMLAGWWMRLSGNVELAAQLEKLPDESGRVPMKELHDWLSDRMEDNFINTCKDLMADFVYAQHLRIGMSRLGEDGTRLRFSLGDHGISPTANLDNFAKAEPPFMADRLLSLANLMEDLDYVIRNGDQISAL